MIVQMPREELLARTFVELADTLVDDFDVVDLLTLLAGRCVDALDVAEAGLMLAAPSGELRVIASSSDAMRVLELLEEQSLEGPCQDCFRTGTPVLNQRLDDTAETRWPAFTPKALEAGFVSVSALPMRLRSQTIGALNMFRVQTADMSTPDLASAQAFADVATIAILQHRAARQAKVVNDQLVEALDTRVVIEQAKGVLAERRNIDVADAFTRLRTYARNNNLRLSDVAREVVAGLLDTDQV
jgi:transcriptional regulator with GAF, ATPase, and Fis domain